MLQIFKNFNKEQKEQVSQHLDPFKKDKIVSIAIYYYSGLQYSASLDAHIHFKNGETEGTHKIKQLDMNFGILIKRIENFIEGLK